MRDEELLALSKVRPIDAAKYLQNRTRVHDIRVLAQQGKCKFCTAIRGNGRFKYRIHVGLLIRYKHSELGL